MIKLEARDLGEIELLTCPLPELVLTISRLEARMAELGASNREYEFADQMLALARAEIRERLK